MSFDSHKNISIDGALRLLTAAGKSTPEEIDELEKKAEAAPDDLALRISLLGYYFWKSENQDTEADHLRNLFWFLDRAPDCVILRFGPGDLPKGNEQVALRWKELIEAHPENVSILENAAQYFKRKDNKLSESLYLKCQSLEPYNSHWPECLCHFYKLTGSSKPALKLLHEALDIEKNSTKKWYLSVQICETAFDAEEINEARSFANIILAQAENHKKDWCYGNAIFTANHILGRIALKDGSQDLAKEYLIKAARTPGSPQLNSFGPRFELAQELLDKNETEIVLQYLEECRRFWTSKGNGLVKMITKIKSGEKIKLIEHRVDKC